MTSGATGDVTGFGFAERENGNDFLSGFAMYFLLVALDIFVLDCDSIVAVALNFISQDVKEDRVFRVHCDLQPEDQEG